MDKHIWTNISRYNKTFHNLIGKVLSSLGQYGNIEITLFSRINLVTLFSFLKLLHKLTVYSITEYLTIDTKAMM